MTIEYDNRPDAFVWTRSKVASGRAAHVDDKAIIWNPRQTLKYINSLPFNIVNIIPKIPTLCLHNWTEKMYNSSPTDGLYDTNTMTSLKERRKLHHRFFEKLGPTGKTLRDMFYALPNIAFYMKDLDCRIMAINPRNCEICNIKNEWDAIGYKSSDLFPQTYAESYMALDRKVIKLGKPILGNITRYPADRSMTVSVANVYPLWDNSGNIIGTARAYYLAPDTDIASSRYGQIHSVALYVEKHFAEELRLADLVAMTNMSLTTFKQAFSEAFKMTPGHYVTTIRLNAARKMLESSDKLLSEIAIDTGFFDQSHFSRIFKKERGITPGEYRRRHLAIQGPKSC